MFWLARSTLFDAIPARRTRIVRHPGDGPDGLPFRQETWRLPSDALHDVFRIRFRTTGNQFKDHFYIDDVSVVEDVSGVPAPFPNCVTDEHIFSFEDTAGILTDPNGPSDDKEFLIRDAVQALIAAHGDAYDFVAVWSTTPQAAEFPAYFAPVYRDIAGIKSAEFDPVKRPPASLRSTSRSQTSGPGATMGIPGN